MTEKIDQLLHDAERAEAGARVAQMMGDRASAKELFAKRDALTAQAVALDPGRAAPGWRDTTLATITQPEP